MNYKSNYRLFGRSKGRSKNNIINEEALQMKVKKIDPLKYNVIDIGSGFGESTLEFAKSDNKKNIIACEKYLDGINKLANLCKTEFLKNVFIYHGNFQQLLDELCPIKSISEIWILFPDPRPKKRHNKRRLIDNNFFIKLKKYLKKNGTINIATDSKQYVSEILNLILIIITRYSIFIILILEIRISLLVIIV